MIETPELFRADEDGRAESLAKALAWSEQFMRQVMAEYQPTHIISMVSGGRDSAPSDAVLRAFGIKVDLVIHGRTGCGIQQTTDHVIEHYGSLDSDFALADAGTAYEAYVMRKGFFGIGKKAHNFAYHILKADPFRATVSRKIRQRKRGVRTLLINGARAYESDNRRLNLKPTRLDNGNLWVNIAHEWTAGDRDLFLQQQGVVINPVAIQLCRSGECMCGTQQSKVEFAEAAVLYPEWGEQMKALDAAARRLHGWGWGEPMPRPADPNQLSFFSSDFDEDFQPMCGGCNRRAAEAFQ
jgi:3'-phosphoadenosine 5'-phosphosulfate sulfotransferase (PAPS reductase)/FAD synthetase